MEYKWSTKPTKVGYRGCILSEAEDAVPQTDLNRRRQPFQGCLSISVKVFRMNGSACRRITYGQHSTNWDGLSCFRPYNVPLLFPGAETKSEREAPAEPRLSREKVSAEQ
jgi:hypothetical protein